MLQLCLFNQPQTCSSFSFVLLKHDVTSTNVVSAWNSRISLAREQLAHGTSGWLLHLLQPQAQVHSWLNIKGIFIFRKQQCLVSKPPDMHSSESMMDLLFSGLQTIIILPGKEKWRTASTTRWHEVPWHIPIISFILLCSGLSSRNFSHTSCWRKAKPGTR